MKYKETNLFLKTGSAQVVKQRGNLSQQAPVQQVQKDHKRKVSQMTIALRCPTVQRQVQNGPPSEDQEAQRRQIMEQRHEQMERDRRASMSAGPVGPGGPQTQVTCSPPPPAGGPAPPPLLPGPPPASAGGPPPPPPLPVGGSVGVRGDEGHSGSGLAAALAGAKLRRTSRPEEGSGSSSPGGVAKSEANRNSCGGAPSGGGGGLMDEMNKLLARRRKAAQQTDKPSDKKEEESQNEDTSLSPSSNSRGPGLQNSTDAGKKPWERANSVEKTGTIPRNTLMMKLPEAKNVEQSHLSSSGLKPGSSTSNDLANDALDFDRLKQEILDEVVRELHKVKDEIINAIRQELSRISTT
ncbi:ena/VASP-like protein isoform X4 [Amblyraja radiata]|uniref:ena/VASP-like protein isoform X4 n=1 Tax=Amblyraja radiata TaxID=386614 RepID=UPI001402177F|nr:ena/VASP-like protein isoform X4 [Amblyraja radiata]